MRLELGTSVRCADDKLGKLADVVIDPGSKRVTHLVVQPRHPSGPPRLVPIELAEETGEREISLRCTTDEARALQSVDDFAYLRLGEAPVDDPNWDVGIEQPLAMPSTYLEGDFGGYVGAYDPGIAISYDRVPKGKVEIRRSSVVLSAEGNPVGRVDGFVVGGADDRITHLVLERGHLWGRREVTIPIDAVTKVETDSVTVGLTTEELGELPAAPVHRWLR